MRFSFFILFFATSFAFGSTPDDQKCLAHLRGFSRMFYADPMFGIEFIGNFTVASLGGKSQDEKGVVRVYGESGGVQAIGDDLNCQSNGHSTYGLISDTLTTINKNFSSQKSNLRTGETIISLNKKAIDVISFCRKSSDPKVQAVARTLEITVQGTNPPKPNAPAAK